MLAPAELKEIHPLGKAPIVTVESKSNPKPLVLAESSFIVEYLIDHFGSYLAPVKYAEGKDGEVGGETEEWTRYRYLMYYAEGSLMPYLVTLLLFRGKSLEQLSAPIKQMNFSLNKQKLYSHQNQLAILHQADRAHDRRLRPVRLRQT